jgi:hypothetical protein
LARDAGTVSVVTTREERKMSNTRIGDSQNLSEARTQSSQPPPPAPKSGEPEPPVENPGGDDYFIPEGQLELMIRLAYFQEWNPQILENPVCDTFDDVDVDAAVAALTAENIIDEDEQALGMFIEQYKTDHPDATFEDALRAAAQKGSGLDPDVQRLAADLLDNGGTIHYVGNFDNDNTLDVRAISVDPSAEDANLKVIQTTDYGADGLGFKDEQATGDNSLKGLPPPDEQVDNNGNGWTTLKSKIWGKSRGGAKQL